MRAAVRARDDLGARRHREDLAAVAAPDLGGRALRLRPILHLPQHRCTDHDGVEAARFY